MKSLVTGASGFLGRHLCRALRSSGHELTEVSTAQADLREPNSLDQFDGKYDTIWHLATWTQAGDFCLSHPGEQWLINQKIHTHVLDWWARCQSSALLVAMGTSCSYDPALPLTEDNYMKGEPIESLHTYAMTKRMMFEGMEALRRQYGLRYLHLVPSTLFGADYHTDGRQPHFIYDLIRKILRGHLFGDPVILWGDGWQTRELVYIEDFVAMAQALTARPVINETVNLGAGGGVTIRDVAACICREVGFDFDRITFDTSRYVGARSKVLDTGKFRQLMPEFVQTPFEEALRKTIFWSRQNMEGQPLA